MSPALALFAFRLALVAHFASLMISENISCEQKLANLPQNLPERATRAHMGNSYRNARAHTNTQRRVLAVWEILTSAESRDYTRALGDMNNEVGNASAAVHRAWQIGSFAMYSEHIAKVQNVSDYRLALRIQKIERARNREADAPKELSDVDNVYDGRVITRDIVESEGYLADSDTRHYNYTQLRGTKGRRDNIMRKASIPPRRAAALDKNMRELRFAMIAEREWWLSVPSKEQLVNAEYDRLAREDMM